jgi:hypothetical protein
MELHNIYDISRLRVNVKYVTPNQYNIILLFVTYNLDSIPIWHPTCKLEQHNVLV